MRFVPVLLMALAATACGSRTGVDLGLSAGDAGSTLGTGTDAARDAASLIDAGSDASREDGFSPADVRSPPDAGRDTGTDGPPHRPVAMTAGAKHTCALLSDGTVECWGATTMASSA